MIGLHLSSPVASSFYGRGDQSRARGRSFLLEYEWRCINADTRQPGVVHVHLLPLFPRLGRVESTPTVSRSSVRLDIAGDVVLSVFGNKREGDFEC